MLNRQISNKIDKIKDRHHRHHLPISTYIYNIDKNRLKSTLNRQNQRISTQIFLNRQKSNILTKIDNFLTIF